jgi:carnitine O-palmitoyltransferase 2
MEAECVRRLTMASGVQVRSVVTPGYDVAAQADLLRTAAAQHTRISREAADGMGFDRHLFALRGLAASRGGAPEPALFTDPTFAAVSGNELSTSTLTAPTTLVLSGFGPVHPQGYGVSYQLPQESLRFCTSAYKPRSARHFNEELARALGTVQALLDASGTGAGVQARL